MQPALKLEAAESPLQTIRVMAYLLKRHEKERGLLKLPPYSWRLWRQVRYWKLVRCSERCQ